MPRIARIVAPGYPHHVTQRGTNKCTIFFDDEDRRYFLQCLDRWTERTGVNLWAYCLMGNHFHLLLEPRQAQDLGRCLHGTTFRYAQHYNLKYARSGRLWQNRYFSCPVDRGEYLWAVVRYIEKNPVRANLTKHAEEWEWSSARAHTDGLGDQHVRLFDWLAPGERAEYGAFLSDSGDDSGIRKSTSTGKPLGDDGFIDKVEELSGRRLKPQRRGRPRRSTADRK